MTDDDKNWLAADYVLGVLRGAERAAFETQMNKDSGLGQAVRDWQQRLNLIDSKPQFFLPTMSEDEVDAALNNVFSRVCKAIDMEGEPKSKLSNPLAHLTKEQLAGMRPAVVRLIASYLVLLERLKAQQARLAGAAGA